MLHVILQKCYDNKMVKSPYNCVIFLVANQQKIDLGSLHISPDLPDSKSIYLKVKEIGLGFVRCSGAGALRVTSFGAKNSRRLVSVSA